MHVLVWSWTWQLALSMNFHQQWLTKRSHHPVYSAPRPGLASSSLISLGFPCLYSFATHSSGPAGVSSPFTILWSKKQATKAPLSSVATHLPSSGVALTIRHYFLHCHRPKDI
ncbi:hypothetical protein BDW74DRAFT_160028 [Aspergillus multicolor]|uniref:uncharacterized protein n=1 Tax=Aspergillus multicolor TaxID=41759 RepID=UPI003CCDA6AD